LKDWEITMARYDNILGTIGNTPLVKLQKLAPAGVNVFVKLESFNPMGSVKDRLALAVIERAEADGDLKPGQTVIEATSGNTGIGLAMVCAQRDYPLVIVMAENFSLERRRMLRYLGARVVLTPASEKGSGMLAKAVELSQKHGYFLCRQFENEANADIHSTTTAHEILDDFADEPLHYWVSGFGTGGTLKGVSRTLKQLRPETLVIAAEPDNAQVLGSGIPQPRDSDGNPKGSHPNFRPHLMQGWSPDFISKLTDDAMAAGWLDEIVPVAGDDALNLSKDLARREGIFVGISSGATLAAALTVARRSPPGTNIVCMLADTGERYLSTPLFADIQDDMSPEELRLSESTPLCQFVTAEAEVDVDSEPEITAVTPEKLDADTERWVMDIVAVEPIVMFALEWCEFCWSVRKLFAALDIPYRSLDLDSVEYQVENRGGKIRAVLSQHTGSPTIPQVYIGGQHVGGGTDVMEMYEDGSLYATLTELGVPYKEDPEVKASQFLPNWLHSH
jgi:cysteine synthase A